MKGASIRFALGLVCAGISGCGGSEPGPRAPAEAPAPWFEEVASDWGIRFEHDSGHVPGRFLMPETICGGAALFDADGDGRLDVYLVQSGTLDGEPDGPNRLFLNRGGSPPRFEDVSAASGAADPGYGMGVACGDYDGDGDADLYVTNLGPNVLLRNEGDGRFVDVTEAAGVGHPGWGTSAAFADLDGDGRLDLYVANYLDWSLAGELPCKNQLGQPDYCSPQNYSTPSLDVLYRNLGDGRFADVSAESGIASRPGTGLGVVCADFDGDGSLDVFVANDGMPDFLWRNRGELRFDDDALAAGCALDQSGVAKAGMGVAVADFDADGDPDLLVCNLNDQSDSLFENEGGVFVDRTLGAGLGSVSRSFTRFGLGWVDFDRDGWLDLYEANGRVNLHAATWSSDPFAEPNLLLRGSAPESTEGARPDRSGLPRFDEVLPRGGTAELLVATSRAAAFGDLDGDGAVDVLVANRDGRPHVLRNVAPAGGGWIGFRLVGERGGDALHAELFARIGDERVGGTARASGSYLASSDPRIVFGVGKAGEARELVVRWPGGAFEGFGSRPAEAYHELREGTGEPRESPIR